MKYHMTEDGPKKCTASIRDCEYGEHHTNKKEAVAAYEEKHSKGSLKGFTKKPVTKRAVKPKTAPKKKPTNDEIRAEKEAYYKNISIDSHTTDDMSIGDLIDQGVNIEPPYDPAYDSHTPDPEDDYKGLTEDQL